VRHIAVYLLAGLSTATLAGQFPYDVSADANAEVQRAFVAATTAHVPVLIFFGANWCEDCRVLDRALQERQSAALLSRAFSVVKVDVGNFDRNLDLAKRFGNPIARGIPAVVVVSVNGELLYSTKAGELADARTMSASGIYDFFRRVSQVAAGAHRAP